MRITSKLHTAIIFLLLLLQIKAISGEYFSDKKSIWLGGGLNFGVADLQDKAVELDPILRFFPLRHILIGPKIQWTNVNEYLVNNEFGIGFDVGYAYGKATYAIPYVQFELQSFNYRTDFPEEFSLKNGVASSLATGCIIPLFDIVSAQIELGTRIKVAEPTVIFLSIGLCGLSKNTAVSFINKIHGMSSAYLK